MEQTFCFCFGNLRLSVLSSLGTGLFLLRDALLVGMSIFKEPSSPLFMKDFEDHSKECSDFPLVLQASERGWDKLLKMLKNSSSS